MQGLTSISLVVGIIAFFGIFLAIVFFWTRDSINPDAPERHMDDPPIRLDRSEQDQNKGDERAA